jgi:hypothetical protein
VITAITRQMNNQVNGSMGNLTPEDIRNGWTAEKLAQYQLQRDRASNLVGGNVVTEFVRPKPAIVVESALDHKPHKWMR